MIGRLNHVAIVVPNLAAASAVYRQSLGARVSEPHALPAHGVTVVFVELPNTKIELLEPLGEASPVRGFLDRNPAGGMHHLCYEVDDSSPRATGSARGAPGCSATASRGSAPMTSQCCSCTRRISAAP
jgi:methylmalonyl-CoA epimerase